MKTVSELAALIKRNGGMQLSYDHDKSKFVVGFSKAQASSRHLDDALENLAEELRRMDSGMVLKEKETAPVKNSGQVTAACGTLTKAGGTCPKCNHLPWSIAGDFYCSECPSRWRAMLNVGDVFAFRFDRRSGAKHFTFNGHGQGWSKVP